MHRHTCRQDTRYIKGNVLIEWLHKLYISSHHLVDRYNCLMNTYKVPDTIVEDIVRISMQTLPPGKVRKEMGGHLKRWLRV